MSAGPSAENLASDPTSTRIVTHERLELLARDPALISLVFGQLSNRMRWSMHQHLFTINPFYLTAVRDAYATIRAVTYVCFSEPEKSNFIARIDRLINNYFEDVASERAATSWYEMHRVVSACLVGTMPNGSSTNRFIYDETHIQFQDALAWIEELAALLKAHPEHTTDTDQAFDLGYYLDQLVRPDILEFRHAELVINSSTPDSVRAGILDVNWEQHIELLLRYASSLRIPHHLILHRVTEFQNASAEHRCTHVEHIAVSIINHIYPLATIENERALEIMNRFEPHMQRAYCAYQYARVESGENLSSHQAYAWLSDNGCPRGYRLPKKVAAFADYVRKVDCVIRREGIRANGLGRVITQGEVEMSGLGHAYSPRTSGN